MKTTITTISIIILFTLFSFSQSTAIYNINFTSVWNSVDHGTLPPNAHWTKLVGANHNSNVVFLEMGTVASQGIEDIAEIGSNTFFRDNIVLPSINIGNTEQYIDGNDLSTATGEINIIGLEINENFPLLTLASMIAPSPDWFIAINSINLRDNNAWETSIIIDIFPYDAGTEDGFLYSLSNSATNPQGVITNVAGAAGYPFNTNKIGTLTITLQNVLSVNNPEQQTNKIKLTPNPTEGFLEISASDSNPIQKIVVYDILGKQIKKITSKNQITTLDISEFYKGIYIVKLHFEDSTIITRKIVKN